MKKTVQIPFLLFLMSLLYSTSSYATRYSPSGGGYNINLNASNSVLASQPTIGSNGQNYYLIAPSGQNGIIINKNTSQAYGRTTCLANFLEGDYRSGLSYTFAYHRLFAYLPEAGFTLNGQAAYRINSNTFFTLYSDNGITQGWQNIPSTACALTGSGLSGSVSTDVLVTQFPFEVRIYVKDLPIDGKIIVPQAMLAGYTRIFQYPGKPDIYVPADKATVKLELATSVINFPSNCKSNIDNLNINHNTLDATEFDSTLIRTVTYQCERAPANQVKLTLDYVTDSDPQKRVPLKSGSNTIYSELSLYDKETNQRGKLLTVTIGKMKNIQIESHISGLNAQPGVYTGNAWLIATYL
ncbi:hypothetical protein [Providencia rettgeri]|uniref:hypothetical protein n=1 Tax=Providencia rettgeri TaxID=587 RepID=UPI00029C07C4|nr:hypothetical protein [Providencia rettgeri]EKT53827.1 fimbrial adhesin [Providencia rettgeri Dmel1]